MRSSYRWLAAILLLLVVLLAPSPAEARKKAKKAPGTPAASAVQSPVQSAAAPAQAQPPAPPAERAPLAPASEPSTAPEPTSLPATQFSSPPGGDLPAQEPVHTETTQPGGSSESPAAERKPVVTGITIEGCEAVPKAEVLKVTGSKIGQPFDEEQVRDDVQHVFDTGWFTDVKVDTQLYNDGIMIIFKVLENPIIKKIVISGNKMVTTEKIVSLMKTKEGEVLNTRTLFEDINAINNYYDRETGYIFKPSHVTGQNVSADGTLALVITDGLVIQDIKIEGNTVYSSQEILKLLHTKPGQLYNEKAVGEDASRIAKEYEDGDWLLDTIRPSLNPATATVVFHVYEAMVEDIKIEGNDKTKAAVILRNIRTKKGEIIRKKKLKKDYERLNNLGYFETVNIVPEQGTDYGKYVLVVKVKEQKTGLATLGLGYTGGGSGPIRSGITGAVSFSERNFKGNGLGASVQWQRGVNIDSLSLSYFDPAINKKQDSINLSYYSQVVSELRQPVANTDPLQYALYDDKRSGGSVTFGHPLNDDLRLFLTLRKETLDFSRSATSDYQPAGLGHGDMNAMSLAAQYDTRDDVFNPHEGLYLNGAVTKGGPPIGGDFDFTKLYLETRKYYPLKKGRTLALRAWGGSLSGNSPLTEIFYAGGSDSIRGYQENSFFGTQFVVLNAEFRFPIANIKMLNGAIFADAGNAWGNLPNSTVTNNNNSKLYFDAGLGVRLVFPTLGLGVIRVDYAFGERGGRSSIGIGQTF